VIQNQLFTPAIVAARSWCSPFNRPAAPSC
jgi:hypothetical protein